VAVSEAKLEETEHGVVPRGDGWFVVNAREVVWFDLGAGGKLAGLEAEPEFEQLGISLFVLGRGEPMSMYHWEADQEDFFVLSGEALLIVEGEERRLRRWDFVHCPPNVSHTIVGAGSAPAVVLAVGARAHQAGEDWGGYPFSELAMRYDASAPHETADPREAYARFPASVPARYAGWLP
jgi:uncharacterized cupin superfamily protein